MIVRGAFTLGFKITKKFLDHDLYMNNAQTDPNCLGYPQCNDPLDKLGPRWVPSKPSKEGQKTLDDNTVFWTSQNKKNARVRSAAIITAALNDLALVVLNARECLGTVDRTELKGSLQDLIDLL